MEDYLVKIGDTKLGYILQNGYNCKENEDIVLASQTMADGTKRRNIAEKKKTIITISFSKITGDILKQYLDLMQGEFEMEYWSRDRIYKTAIFRLTEQPETSLEYQQTERYDEFEIGLESV